MSKRLQIMVAVAIGIIFGIILTLFSVDAVPPAQAQEQTPGHNQFLRQNERQTRALEDIASTLKEIKRSMK